MNLSKMFTAISTEIKLENFSSSLPSEQSNQSYHVEIPPRLAHARQSSFFGHDCTEDLNNHDKQIDEVNTSSNSSQDDESQLNERSRVRHNFNSHKTYTRLALNRF